jgi:hypothetical protein
MPEVNPGVPEKRLHIVIGTPDPDGCPICRAHFPDPAMKIFSDPEVGEILAQALSFGEILRCPCPLCAEARGESFEE